MRFSIAKHEDLDFATDARPEEIGLSSRNGPMRSIRVGEAFGTIGIRKG